MDKHKDFSAFTCLRCGICCQGEGGIVLTEADVDRLCAHLGIEVTAFFADFTECVGGKRRLRTNDHGWCVFFREGCSVHPAKPKVCQAWPFFRGNMIDENSWRMAQDACPGINPEAGHAEFVAQGHAYLDNLEPEPDTATGPNALKRIRPEVSR